MLAERDGVAAALEARLDGHPAAKVMASMPGIATNSAARLIAAIGDGGGFRTADQFAAYAGLAPVTRSENSTRRLENPHSLSYQPSTLTWLPTASVSGASKIDE